MRLIRKKQIEFQMLFGKALLKISPRKKLEEKFTHWSIYKNTSHFFKKT